MTGSACLRSRFAIIYNPAAGQRRKHFYGSVIAALRAQGITFEERPTAGRSDAEALVRAAVAKDFDAVVAAGGDGTINEALNGLIGSPLPLGIIPLGTANVFAAEMGLPVSADVIAETLITGPEAEVYVGRANNRAFGLMVGVGIDAHIVRDVDPSLKRRIGKGAYAWETFRQIVRGPKTSYDISVDGIAYRAASVVVAKGHFDGGRFVAAPKARLTEPSFEIVMATRVGRWAALRYGLALMTGRLSRLADVRIVTGARVAIQGPAGEPVQGDGDELTELPVEIELAPRPINLIVPTDSPVLNP